MPELILEMIPSTPGQTFPYLYLEPGIDELTGFIKVTISIESVSHTLSFEICNC